MVTVVAGILALAAFATEARSEEAWTTLTVVEEPAKGKTTVVDLGVKGDSPGDMTVWHEPIMDMAKKTIGTSNGFCVCTVAGKISECQWTLTTHDGTISLASSEAEKGTSPASITGGTGVYIGASGEAAVTHNADGTYTVVMKLKKKKV
ncbi:hypothetical protein EG829_02415 [bacterium]|nr:hypothetical protein [bacterium]